MVFAAGQKLTGGQLNQLAEDALFSGTELVTFGTATSHTRTVSFGKTLEAAPSRVGITISSGAGVSADWTWRTDTYTTTSFRLLLVGPSGAWTDVPVIWQPTGTASLDEAATTTVAWTSLPSGVAGWTHSSEYARRSGVVSVQVDAQRSGSGISSTDTAMGTLPAGFRPARTVFASVMNQTTREVYLCQVATTGVVTVIGLTAATSERVRQVITFPAG